VIAIVAALAALGAPEADREDLDFFEQRIRPVLAKHCYQCHSAESRKLKGDLRLDLSVHRPDSTVVAGKPDKSRLIEALRYANGDLQMPPARKLPGAVIADFVEWVKRGAPDPRPLEDAKPGTSRAEPIDVSSSPKRWAFRPFETPELPEVRDTSWIRSPIDHFVLARLERDSIRPAPEADRRTLIRRLSFDLTGLPPTLEEVDAFLSDGSARAYERVVGRLLDSPRYGERMAVMWLDLARYGDTSVYHTDEHREMWAWRDGVIAAYNANRPFDVFSTEQLAGDLVPDATLAQRIASGFNRNNGTTNEGGTIEEEFRVEYAVDRVKTTALTWLGLSLECAQCHDHKYDPISQEDYYRFFAFFNVSADKGMQSGSRNAKPIVEIPNPENEKKLPAVLAERAELEREIDSYPKKIEPALASWVDQLAERIRDPKGQFDPRDASLHLTFDETEGNVVADQAREERQGRVRGRPEWTSARVFGGLRFGHDGETFVEAGGLGDFERDQSFTLSLWIRPEKTRDKKDSQGSWIARLEDDKSLRGYELYHLTNQRFYFQLAHDAGTNAIRVRSDRELMWNEWQHVCVTYDGSGSAGGIRLYVDSKGWRTHVEQNNLTLSIRTEKPLRIGSRPGGFRPIGTVDEVRVFPRSLSEDEIRALFLRDTVASSISRKSRPTEAERQALLDDYLSHEDREYPTLLERRAKLENEENELRRPMTTVLVMGDRNRSTYVLRRGSYADRTDTKVQPGLPSILPQLRSDDPRNRLGLARWLFRRENPLTARVAVNRYWQLLFGVGLVATPEDFGSQGDSPSHPKLLDWLAADFRDNDWDVKRTLRSIVTSATYRQSSAVSREAYARDPANRRLARGARFRLQAEFLRDNALALSGLLVDTMGGPGVKPYQPPKLWNEILQGGDPLFVQDHGDKLYRRSVYTYWRRTCPPPNMQLFDAPTREKCVVRRSRTNSPTQALVTLNDVQYVEAARQLAERMMRNGGKDPKARVAFGFRLGTARTPTDSETATLLDVYKHAKRRYETDLEAAKKLISSGESKRDESLDPIDHAAMTIIASLLLNLDETMTRE